MYLNTTHLSLYLFLSNDDKYVRIVMDYNYLIHGVPTKRIPI